MRKLVTKEVAAGCKLAAIEGDLCICRCLQPQFGRTRLPQPHPGNDNVAERIKIEGCVCQGGD